MINLLLKIYVHENSSLLISKLVAVFSEQELKFQIKRGYLECPTVQSHSLLCFSSSANGKRLVGFGTGECGNYVETTICQPLITILLQQQNKSPLLHRTQWAAVFFVRAFSWFTLRSLTIGNTHFLIYVLFTPFFGFDFRSLLATNLRKYYVLFVYILHGKMGKMEKNGKKITQLK